VDAGLARQIRATEIDPTQGVSGHADQNGGPGQADPDIDAHWQRPRPAVSDHSLHALGPGLAAWDLGRHLDDVTGGFAVDSFVAGG
jgi:hypothetical protein